MYLTFLIENKFKEIKFHEEEKLIQNKTKKMINI